MPSKDKFLRIWIDSQLTESIQYESTHCFSYTIHYESIHSYNESEMNRFKGFENLW